MDALFEKRNSFQHTTFPCDGTFQNTLQSRLHAVLQILHILRLLFGSVRIKGEGNYASIVLLRMIQPCYTNNIFVAKN